MVSFQGGHKAFGGDEDEESNEVAKDKFNGGGSSRSSVGGMVKVMKLRGATELASRKHALSERKRRKRINCHYDSLRHFFPRLHKSDKASVLAKTVRRIKELKKMVANVEERCSGEESQRSFFIPGENDEITVSYVAGTTVRAIVCCEDRAGLNQDLAEAIQSVRGKPVKAVMATIGGRTKAEVVVEWPERGGGREEDLKRALKAVVENRVLGRTRTGLISHGGYTGSEQVGFGRSIVDGERPKVSEQMENVLADGLIVKSY